MSMTEDAINFYLIFITAAILTYVWLSFHSFCFFCIFFHAVHIFILHVLLGV